MRKYLISILSFVLTVVMMFLLVACNNSNNSDDNSSKSYSSNGNKPSYEDIVGVWTSDMDLTQLFLDNLADKADSLDILDYCEFDQMRINMTLIINDDDTFKVCIDKNEIDNLMNTLFNNIIDGIIDMQKETFDQYYGMSLEDMLVQADMTEDEYRHYLSSSLDTSFDFGKLNKNTNEYENEGTFSFDGKNIIFNNADGTKENCWYEKGRIYLEKEGIKFAFERK